MTTVITVNVKSDLEDRYTEVLEDLGEDEMKSELARDLLETGFRERDVPLLAQLDLPNRAGAQMEDDRERGESNETVTRRFLKEAVEAQEADAIDAGEELRREVETEQKHGESLDDAVRRLLQTGADQTRAQILYRIGSPREWCSR